MTPKDAVVGFSFDDHSDPLVKWSDIVPQDPSTVKTIVVNFSGAPSAGKTTAATGVFSELKRRGYNAEYVHEFAKDLTWEGRHRALKIQPYILGKMYKKIEMLMGQVSVIVTDSPLFLSSIYNTDNSDFGALFTEFVWAAYKRYDNLLYRVHRTKPYQNAGRNQTEQEAMVLDGIIHSQVLARGISYDAEVSSDWTPSQLADDIESRIRLRRDVAGRL